MHVRGGKIGGLPSVRWAVKQVTEKGAAVFTASLSNDHAVAAPSVGRTGAVPVASKAIAFLSALTMLVVATSVLAPRATAATGFWAEAGINVEDGSCTPDPISPCRSVAGATVYTRAYTGRRWTVVGKARNTGASRYTTVWMHTGYRWAIYAYKWVRASRCVWHGYGGRRYVGALNPYSARSGLLTYQIWIRYRRSHRVC